VSEFIRVVCVGPSITVRGGISRLVRKLKDSFPKNIHFRVIATYSDYIGDGRTNRWARCAQPGLFFWSLTRVLVIAVTQRSTVFHVHFSQRGSTLRKGVICVILRVLRCQYVVQAHACEDALFHSWVPAIVRRMLLWGIGGGRYVIVLTQFWRNYYALVLKLPLTKLLVLPNPADIPRSIPNRTSREGVELLFLGRVGERKGAFDVIHAFAALPKNIREKCHLTLAGDGETDIARGLLEQLGCSAQASVLGWVSGKDVDLLLAEADVFLLPSHGEGMSVALLEAMAWGLAVVSTASGGADEFLVADQNCLLVKPGDSHDIAGALSALAGDVHLRLRLGKEARRTAVRFSVDKYIGKLTRLYEELASDSAGSERTQAEFTAM
jgi:glycosyltransferase involved in cell wall biosynthesis